MLIETPEKTVLAAVRQALKAIQSGNNDPVEMDFQVDIPKESSHGDLTSNVALRGAKILKMQPLVLAEKIRERIIETTVPSADAASIFEKIEVVKPGFINFWFSGNYLRNILKKIELEKGEFGRDVIEDKKNILLEFVSANPTGPLTVAHGRQAAIGDALANILRFAGHKVSKEYFINDDGKQIKTLGLSIQHHYLAHYGVEIPFPEDGYRGEYIKVMASELWTKHGDKFVKDHTQHARVFLDYGVDCILADIKHDLADFDVHFDSWFSQRTLTPEIIHARLDALKKPGHVFESEGATWFRSTAFGDTKDRVVIKSDGEFTYFAPDIAYHYDKYSRGYDSVIDIWGPDHHGYIPRLKAAVEAMGYDRKSVHTLIVQLATLYRSGEVLSMSTRKGEFITLREVMDEVGKDATRFFFLMRKLESHLDFDLEIAKAQSQDNPVYYIQYAHARIWSIKDAAAKLSADMLRLPEDLTLLKETEEIDIIRHLAQFPAYVRSSAVNMEPYFIIFYLNGLAALFHNFYSKHKVISDNLNLSKARLYLIDCVRICLASGLNLLGVTLPKKM